MKKIIPFLLALFMLASCSGAGSNVDTPTEMPMPEIIDQLCEGVKDVPPYEATQLTEDDFTYFAGIPYADGLNGYQADALISSIPHSLVLLHSDNGDTAELAQEMLENADPIKWICVAAEVKQTAYTEHYVILVMSSKEITEGIMANFENAVNDGKATMLDEIKADAGAYENVMVGN